MSNKEQNSVKNAIKAYLDERAKNDELFAASYAKPNKNIDECFKYVVGEARKRGNAVYVSDEEVFGWAVHYYDEDDIKINALPKGERVSTKASVDLTDEEKEKAREQALQEYKQQCIDKLKAADELRAKRAAERKKAQKKAEQNIPNLFMFDE